MRRSAFSLALAISAAEACHWTPPDLLKRTDDPYARSPRSKGEKARNKRHRRH